jgi:hypothetical protein
MSEYLDEVHQEFDPEEYQSYDWDSIDDPSKVLESDEDPLKKYPQKKRGGAIFTKYVLAELSHLSEEAHSSIENVKQKPTKKWERDERDDIDLFFAFVGQAQERLLREAILQHVFDDEAVTDEIRSMVHGKGGYTGYGYYQCLEMLEASGAIEDGLKGEIGQVRDERNETVHEITRWLFAEFDPDDIKAQIDRGERSVVRLLELVYGFNLE